jgi:hypothetical protein
MPLAAAADARAQIAAESLSADVQMLRRVLPVLVVTVLLFAVNDLALTQGSSAALGLAITGRVLMLAPLGYALWRLWRPLTRTVLEATLLPVVIGLAVGMVLLHLSRPPGTVNPVLTALIMIMGMHIAFPIRPARVLAVSSALTGAVIAITLWQQAAFDGPLRTAIIVSVLLANGLGWFISQNRRTLLTRTIEARVELTAALAELRTLRGIIPVCSGCSNVRLENDEWQALQSYVSAHTHAEFSHGLCPDCAARLYPDWAQPTDATDATDPPAR